MGTRFLFKTEKQIGGMTLQLKHKGISLAKTDAAKITGSVARAKSMLSTTIAAISCGPGQKERDLADKYFLTNGGPSQAEWQAIQSKLELIYNSLNTDMTIKLGADGAHGNVKYTTVAAGTPGSFQDTNGDHITFAGHELHVSKKTLLKSPELGAITVLHESSHKYANTNDYDKAGYRKEDDSGWCATGLTPANALNNADSFAYFVYRVGESRHV
jgi:hypothetical protein